MTYLVEASEDREWTCCFENVPLYRTAARDASGAIVYTLAAQEVEGFKQQITGGVRQGFTVTYTALRPVPDTGNRTDPVLLSALLGASVTALMLLFRRRRSV